MIRFPSTVDFKRLSHFVLTVMEGGVMQSRSYRNVEPFDMAVAELRAYFDRLLAEGAAERGNYWSSVKLERTTKGKA